MSDSRRRYRAIVTKLEQLYPEAKRRKKQHLAVLAAFISGIVGSQSTQMRQVARRSGLHSKVASRTKQLERWYRNDALTAQTDYLPYLRELLTTVAHGPVALAIDATEIGRGCMALMVHLLYQRRAIPLAWLVVARPKGHSPAATHIALLEEVRTLLPADVEVILLGDGEFDSVELQAFLRTEVDWHYVCRTAKDTLVTVDTQTFPLDDLCLLRNMCVSLEQARFTEQAFGPVHVIGWWDQAHDAPLYLVTSFELMDEACYWYRRRMQIETFFSDQKSRGFQLHKSHLADPKRLMRLLIAACLAYIWIIYLGTQVHARRLLPVLHRTDRCDLSLFQLGLEFLQYLFDEDLDIIVSFSLDRRLMFSQESVR